MQDSGLLFSPLLNWFILGAVVIIVAAYVYYSYNTIRTSVGKKLAIGFSSIKLFVILLLFTCLVQPVASMEKRLSGDGVVAVLLDTSESMAIKDSLGGKSRIDSALSLLLDEGELLEKIADDFTLSSARFDESLKSVAVNDLEDVIKDLRPQTSILGSLASLSKAVEAGKVTAVVMITDGRETSASADWSVVKNLGVPVFTVGVGTDFTKDKNFCNLAILSVDSPRTGYLNNALSLTVSVGAFNVPEGTKFARLSLFLGDKEVTAPKVFKMPQNGSIDRVNLEFEPGVIGLNKYVLKLNPIDDEEILEDNERDVFIDVREPRLRVLYLEGVLRPEYGFLRRTLSMDPDVKITSLVRTRKDSFKLQGENEKVDLSRGLPDKEEDFKEFDIIILGDIAATAFRDYQLKNLREWVEQGGGLLAIGGHNAFTHGGWSNTPLAQVFPVVMSSTDEQVDVPMIVKLTAAGKNHPIFKGLDFSSDAMQKGKGALGGCTAPQSVKSGAQVLADGMTSKGKKHILCAVQKFGSGRVSAFTADTSGKAHRELVGLGYGSPYEKFWSQMVRWLAGFDEIRKEKDVYLRLSMESRFAKANKRVTLNTEIVDPKGILKNTPSIDVIVTAPDGEETELTHSLNNKELTGSASFKPTKVGIYKFKGVLRDSSSNELDTTEYMFLCGQPWLESSNLSLDEEALKQLARDTGGRYYNIVSASKIPNDIAKSRGKGVERVTQSLWNNPVMFLLLAGLLCLEWFLRRRNQLL